MHARVRAAAACRAVAMMPGGAAAIAAQASFGRPVWAAPLRHALLAMTCALGAAATVLADTPANTVAPANPAHAIATASRADPAATPTTPAPANSANSAI